MANSFVVSSLPDYVEQNRPLLRSTSVIGARTAQLFTRQSGVKGSAAINLLNTAITFGNGAACGWNEAGATTLTQRTIVTGQVKVNMAICEKTLIGKWAEKEVEIIADPKALPFEEDVTASIVEGIQEALENALWQGDTTSSTDNLKYFDGMVKILSNASGVISETIASGSSYIDAVRQVLMAIPGKAIKDDTVIFCAPSFLRGYEQALVAANLYHFEPGRDMDDITIPGSKVKLVAVAGLEGTKKLVGGRLSNFFYGYDVEDAPESFDLWYSKDNREFRLAVEFNAGVQVAFPDEVVLGAYTTLGSVSGQAEQLAAIAENTGTIATKAGAIATNTEGVGTAAGKLAGAVNNSNQIETHPNTSQG